MPRQLLRHARLQLQRRSTAVLSPFILAHLGAGRARDGKLRSYQAFLQYSVVAALQTVHTDSRRYSSRATLDPSASSSTPEPELISLDCIEVITTTTTTSVETSTDTFRTTTEQVSSFTVGEVGNAEILPDASCSTTTETHAAPSATRASSAAVAPGLYCDVHTLDPFARGRVANFIRRMGRVEGDIFRVKEVPPADETASAGRVLPRHYVATCRIPLPEPHGFHIAQGLGEDRKEAELLAAMHAERVCDALGVPLFRLKTAQLKHAEAVRLKEGRYAPLPDDPVKPLGTPVPPPLRLLRSPPPPSSSPASNERASQQSPASLHVDIPAVAVAEAASQSSSSKQSNSGASSSHSLNHDFPSKETIGAPLSSDYSAIKNTVSSEGSPRSAKCSASVSPALEANDGPGSPPPFTWPTAHPTTFLSRCPNLNESRCHDPYQLCAAYAPTFSDAEHAARVQAYASTVVYPWQSGWEGVMDAHEEVAASSMRGNGLAAGGDASLPSATVAAAVAAVTSVQFDPTESGMWQMVNDRNLRCSPTPEDALVLPYVFDGPHALARVTEYYQQHDTTLAEHLKVRQVTTPGLTTRMSEAELRLIGVSVTARGKSQTEEMAVRLAAMHAELLVDALGLPLFPKDDKRQARHAAVVAGYGRWATDPLGGSTASPNPHDALPRPLKSQIGTDDIWLSADASPQMRGRRTESEHIIATHNFVVAQTRDAIEVNPPSELLEEAYAMLREWQTHIARSRYTNLYVLFDMNDRVFRATTITPVPARFGPRGGTAIGSTAKKAMQLCALHAMDTLCALGVPLCVDAAQERRYVQRRAALGQVIPHALDAATLLKKKGAATPSEVSFGVSPPSSSTPTLTTPYLPSYYLEGHQVRLPPPFADTVHAKQLRLPQDFCLYSADNDEELSSVGNEVKICVENYLKYCMNTRLSELRAVMASMRISNPPYTSPYLRPTPAAPQDAGLPKDEIANTELWAATYLQNAPPSVLFTTDVPPLRSHCVAYLQLPLPGPFLTTTAAAERKDGPPQCACVTAAAKVRSADGSAGSAKCQLRNPTYVIAAGMSLKRKDAVRACYLHAASLLYTLGIDVLALFPVGVSRHRCVPNYAALEKYLGKEAVVIIPPYTPDGERNTQPLRNAPAYAGAWVDLDGTERQDGDGGSARAPPRAVLHKIMKAFLEDPRHITLPRRRQAAGPNSPFMPVQRRQRKPGL
ncbi:putative mitochondrial hypothetical protein [Leptomonas pyrrhocoris]|uniref:REH2 DRSM domain-containing protein n=1 Tax=Leptomonas pyrrhocoris TaxID=157538 RepID=A0A0N0DTV3_LEPPY|nr:putative mitochondrial hypothetical protein [Leptomonas pyrrhocoris]KPA78014.1 putative mitochondrial hypothetical protein [Leptomonas pyrrhocoris]|eukprot:XP_015656453.1 putative mitochondrial hypothetical protein [Leptomonas pyrrhocoris]